MVNLIVGSKGTGKTKVLIDQINQVSKTSKGNVVCIEKNMNLIHELDRSIRLIDADSYHINSYEKFYGFLAGLLAGNYDITDIYVDGILRIGHSDGGNVKEFEDFLKVIDPLVKENKLNITFTLSTDEKSLPASLKELQVQYL